MTEQDQELAEAAELAASAVPSPDCPADRHGTYAAHRKHGCRCPQTVALVKIQRAIWEVGSRTQREMRRIYERAVFREDVVQELLKGNRSMPHRHSERREAFRRAVEMHKGDVQAIAEQLNFPRREVQRKLRATHEED